MKLKYIGISMLALMMAACGSNSDYRNAIPSRSAAVVSFDMTSMAEKSGLSGNNANTNLQNRLKSMAKSGISGADGLIDRIFEDVSESGLGLKDKVYFFSGEQAKTAGAVIKVEDEGKLDELLEMLAGQGVCDKVKDKDGCKWTVVGNILLAYKSHAMLLVADNKGGDPSSLVRQASMWLRQEGGEGFSSTSDFKLMDSKSSDIVAWNTLEVFPTDMIYPIVMGISAELNLKNVKAVSSIDFENGKIEMDVETVISDKIVSGIMDRKDKVMSSVEGGYLDMFPSNTPFWAAANIKGGEFFDFICSNPSVKRYFDKSMLPLDFASIFDAVEGDVVLAMSGTNSREFIAYADIRSKDFMNSFESLKSMAAMSGGQVYLNNHGENGYEFKTYDGSIVGLKSGPMALWFGVKGDKLYLTNKESLIDRRVLGLTLKNKDWGKKVAGQKFFMASDLTSLDKIVELKSSGKAMSALLGVLGGLDFFTVESSDGKNLLIEVVMKDRNRNPLSVVLNQ